MTLGVLSILYGAKLAFAQTDIKRLVAYISVSHMGFILLGIYAFNEMAMQGVVMQMIAHGISTGALFIIAGTLHERLKTREMEQMGGLWTQIPKLGAMTLLFVMASLGLPGLGNFIAEILILVGSFLANEPLTIVASLGMIAATIYSLRIMQKIFYGEVRNERTISDLGNREMVVMTTLAIVIIGLGLFPNIVFQVSKPAVQNIIESVNTTGKPAHVEAVILLNGSKK
jgi:NADH-quinone oxidoreductase subunit M